MTTKSLRPVSFVGKMIGTSKERFCVNMPNYYVIQNWEGIKHLSISPEPFIRRIPIIKQVLPYHVGDRVKFKLILEKEKYRNEYFDYVVLEQFGDDPKSVSKICEVKNNDLVTGDRIPVEQSVSYYVCRIIGGHIASKQLIFSTTVQSWDTVYSKWSWAIVGAIFSLCTGIILWALGIIEIVPAWRLWLSQ
jgi:hypothetical protein